MIEYYTGQHQAIADIYYAAIHQTAAAYYSQQQINAWARLPIDYDGWRMRCELKRPFVAVDHGAVVGFLELDPHGHIDCHYVHPDHNRRGHGGRLLQHAIQTASDAGLAHVNVEASRVAKGLYLRNGFRVIAPNQAVRHGVTLENWKMQREF